MFRYSLLVMFFYFVSAAIEDKEPDCEDRSGHKNYHLLPKQPNCGLNIIPMNYYIFEGVEWPNASAKVGEFPWVANLEIHRKKKQNPSAQNSWEKAMNCTGVLINNRYILTAAHCVNQTKDYHVRVVARLGKWWLPWDELDCAQDFCRKDRVVFNVEEIIRHAGLTYRGHNDICLLRLNTEVQFNEYVRPICLPKSCYWHKKSLQCYTMTFAAAGRLNRTGANDQYVKSEWIKKYFYEIQVQYWCQTQFHPSQVIMDTQMCVGGLSWRDACKGDPGAPLTLDVAIRGKIVHYLMGILGYKRDCVRSRMAPYVLPAVFTRVSYYIGWILNNIKP